MTKTYLVTFEPLESFAFGTERNFRFDDGMAKTSLEYYPYFVTTNPIPEQTTLLGALRYVILNANNMVNSNFKYSFQEKSEIEKLIGGSSFSFLENNVQSFGQIKSISPLFILKEVENAREDDNVNNTEIIVPNPFNNKNLKVGTVFSPMALESAKVVTNHGQLKLPKLKLTETDKAEFDVKKGYGRGYYNISKNQLEPQVFKASVLVGNRKRSNRDGTNEDGFFKRQVYKMTSSEYKFAIYVDAESLPDTALVPLGQKKSLFRMNAREQENSLKTEVSKAISKMTPQGVSWYYALSDLHLGEKQFDFSRTGFSIVEKKSIRNLETDLGEEKTFTQRIKRSDYQFNLIKRGSVFYSNPPELDEKFQVAGYNYVLEINGTKEQDNES